VVKTSKRVPAILKGIVLFLLFSFIQAAASAIILVVAGMQVLDSGAPVSAWQAIFTVAAAAAGIVAADVALTAFFKATYPRAVVLTAFLALWVLLTAAILLLKPSLLVTQDGLRAVAVIVTVAILRWRLSVSKRAEVVASTFDEHPAVPEAVPFTRGLASLGAATAGCLPQLAFMVWGLVQLSAVYAQVRSFTHLPGFLSGMASLALTYLPLIGGVVGFFGAKDVWGWPWWQAALLYFGAPLGLLLLSVVFAALAAATGKRFA
jgi:hypothetical protein